MGVALRAGAKTPPLRPDSSLYREHFPLEKANRAALATYPFLKSEEDMAGGDYQGTPGFAAAPCMGRTTPCRASPMQQGTHCGQLGFSGGGSVDFNW